MRTFLMMKIYAAIGLAILGVRLAFEYLEFWELVQFLGSAVFISIVATLLHKYFEYQAHKTGKNAMISPNFFVQMIVITILASTGVYILISYLTSGEFSIGFDIVFYSLFIPAVVLFGIYMYFQIIEQEYNHKLDELKKK
jgi:small-conductance mechanosensitive channel